MRKKNTLYTVNRWNRPAFLPQENLFYDGGDKWSQLAFNSNPLEFTTAAYQGLDPTELYKQSKNAFGISKENNPFSKGNIGGTLGGLVPAVAPVVGGLASSAISGGLSSGAGSAISGIGSTVGSAIGAVNPILGAAVSVGSGILGGVTNALFGESVNQEKLNAAREGTAQLNSFVSNAGSFDDIKGPQAVANVQDAYKGGIFSSGSARRKNEELKQRRIAAKQFADRSITNNVNNLIDDQMNDALTGYYALGGLVDTIGNNDMGAIGYGFMSDYLAAKKKQAENKNQMTNMFMGTPSTMFADGGGIHIKPSHRGRLTELKKRTGKTEAELYNDGNPAHKKMVVFARNSRKWKHSDGGPLNLFYQDSAPLFAFGGDLQTNSADFGTGLVHVNAGGSHEESPYDGVQMGVDQNGTPNLVEEGEVIFNDYVYSQRLTLDDEAKKKFHLPRKKDITFADAAKKLEKEIKERPNDPISEAGFNAMLSQLAEEQERQKQEMEAERAKAAFEALSPEEQTAIMQRAAQEEAMQQQAMQEQAMAQQQVQSSPEEIATTQQQEQMGQPDVVEGQPVMAEGGNLFDKGGNKKNVGKWKDDKENHWDVFTKPGLKRYIESIRQKLTMAPDDEAKTAIRKEAMNELNSLQQSYYDYVREGAADAVHGYDDNVLNHQKMFDRLYGNTGFYTKDENGNIKNLIAEAINLPKGAATEDKPDNWFDGYNGPRTSIRNFGSTAYGDDKYYQDLVDEFKKLGLTYAPNDNWKDGNGTLYGLSIPEIEATKEAAENAPKVWDWNTGSWINKPTETTSEQPIITTSTPSPQTSDEETDIAPRHKAEWLRYAGLFGPAVGLGLQMTGVGKPDYSNLEATLKGSGDVALADYKPLGDYLTYRPMDIWYEQNALNAQARATDRALGNTTSPSKAAGILASGYNSQLASGDLYRKALEYNDALRERTASFNRGTNQFNAEAYNRNSQFNADARNRARQYSKSLALQAAAQKLDADAGWYNSLYGNLSGLFGGLSELGRENAMFNMLADSAADGVYGNLGTSNTGKRWTKEKKACGGKIKNRRRLKL